MAVGLSTGVLGRSGYSFGAVSESVKAGADRDEHVLIASVVTSVLTSLDVIVVLRGCNRAERRIQVLLSTF
jgi:hypothetical protein